MLAVFRRQVGNSQLSQQRRALSQVLATIGDSALSSTSATLPSRTTQPYFIPRNTRGNLPVYSDVRNAGGRYLVLVRNVEGNVSILAKELTQSLFPKDAPEVYRMKVQINQSKHLIISGGMWKNNVIEWLKAKGF